MSATTQVKVFSSEIFHFCTRPRVSFPGSQYRCTRRGECATGVPGSKSVAGRRTVYIGTWEGRDIFDRSCRGAEEATRRYGVPAFGLTYSRGVDRVMSVEDIYVHSKGSALIRKDVAAHSPSSELDFTMLLSQCLISDIAITYIAFLCCVLLKRVLVKSRMWEICKSGSVRGMRLLARKFFISLSFPLY